MEAVTEQKSLNLYQGVRGIAIKLLNRVDRTDAYLDKLLEIEIKNSELCGSEKALLFEIVHGVVRWLGRIDWILNGFFKGQFSKCIPNVKNALRVALYQILFIDKINDIDAINDAVEFVRKLQGQKSAELTGIILRNISRNKESIRYPNPEEDIIAYFSAYYSHPSWLVKRWINRFGKEETEKLLVSNNNKPTMTLCVNTIKTNDEELKSLLQKVDLKYNEGKFSKNFFKLTNLTNITAWEYYAKGFFTIQDESNILPVLLLNPKPNQKILNLCSPSECKTVNIANMMNNEGEIVLLDKFESRMKIQKRNLERLGVSNVRMVIADVDNFTEYDFDSVIIDAPSTGFGTLAKKPDLKWKQDLIDVRKISSIQYRLLEKGANYLKKNGTLVYTVNSFEPEETHEIIERFLTKNKNFKLIDASNLLEKELVDSHGFIQTMPHLHSVDGIFAAKIIKEN
ncbi:16S rRNA (cytosine(967)-C(5))-methyltransferase RsmB [Melioribacteraceae bacterium 4301-Me]|uniref:16S rRNA (cytosine(967)-C(5))-methyltransferase RsmB n=1 Tax=Pyranulibacter aquaticus TaxID=3163344 RepID=UPI00359947E1